MAKAISDDARKRISKKVGAAADLTCRDHLGGITQEPAINVAIGEAVARALDGLVYDGYEIKALSQPIPDRGRGSMEGWLGADIYVGIRVIKNRHTYLSKGFLVQAKLDGDRGRAASRQLPNQIEQMKSHTKAAYVWVYTPNGVLVSSTKGGKSPLQPLGGISELISDTLSCTEGDPKIGLPKGPMTRQAVGVMLSELGARTGVGINIRQKGSILGR